jgi:hypothetical protein
MEFEQLRLQQQENARNIMYQNSGYQFDRRDKKTLILDIVDTSSVAPLSTATEFSIDLFEPLVVDKLSDILVDNVSTYNSLLCDTSSRTAFSLSINEFNINSNVASSSSGQQIFNKILIPNENNDINDIHSVVIHKGKKMNYICSINPTKITKLSGKLTDLAGNSMFSTTNKTTKLYSVSLTSGVTSDVVVGTSFQMTVGGVAHSFKTSAHISENSTKIYFTSDDDNVTGDIGTITSTIVAVGTGLNGLTPDDSTKRSGNYPRFTVEFIIEAR